MGLERLDGDEVSYERMREAVESLPFLTVRKLVVLREPGKQKAFAEHIEQFLDAIADTTDVIIVEPKLDKRLSYYKTLKKRTEFKEFGELDINGLARWAVEYAKESEGSLTAGDARFLVERVGTNQQLLAHELDKLLMFDAQITRSSIELLTEPLPQSTIFELLEAAFAGRMERAMELYSEQRTLKVEPQQIIAMLAWQLHVLALIKAAGSRTPDDIARTAKLNPFVVKKSATVARLLTPPRLKTLVHDLFVIDGRLKREPIDPDEVLKMYLLGLADRAIALN
jgi:DNA polymerase-3 subunit delta